MAAFTRVNGAAAAVVDVLTSTAQIAAFLVTVKDDSNTAIDLRADDGVVDGNLENLLKELAPLMYFATNSSAGTVTVVMDGHANDAASLQSRVRHVFEAAAGDNDSTVIAAGELVAAS